MGINMGHDRSVAVVENGKIVIAIEQERLDRIKHSVGFMLQAPEVMELVRRSFRPEFLNRIDELILFEKLDLQQITEIVRIQLGRLQELLDSRKIRIDVTDMAVSWLAETGYNPEYGARPLKRVIQRYLQDPLAVQLLEGTIKDGDKLTITCDGNGLSFTDDQLAAA